MSNPLDHFDTSEFFSSDEVGGLDRDYADYLDSLPPSKSDVNFTAECFACSELITDFELQMNNGHCPNCNSTNIAERRDLEIMEHDTEDVRELNFDDDDGDIPF